MRHIAFPYLSPKDSWCTGAERLQRCWPERAEVWDNLVPRVNWLWTILRSQNILAISLHQELYLQDAYKTRWSLWVLSNSGYSMILRQSILQSPTDYCILAIIHIQYYMVCSAFFMLYISYMYITYWCTFSLYYILSKMIQRKEQTILMLTIPQPLEAEHPRWQRCGAWGHCTDDGIGAVSLPADGDVPLCLSPLQIINRLKQTPRVDFGSPVPRERIPLSPQPPPLS